MTTLARSAAAALVSTWLFTAAIASECQAVPRAAGDFVELDVVALDREDHPVTDLRQEDFQIKEDRRLVEIKTFARVTALGSTEPDDARSVTLLMDDVGVPMAGTSPMRSIAQVMLGPAGRGDDISAVRLSSRSDEPFGDVMTARDRIDGYRGGVVPFSTRETPETALDAIARISRQLEASEHRRKVIICLGLPVVCDVEEPVLGGSSVLWPHWVAALGAAARANVSVYSVDPTGLNRTSGARGIGLPALTGGGRFSNSNNFVHAADVIWDEASRYYLLGYWPPADPRELHTIDVIAARKGVHLHVRRRR